MRATGDVINELLSVSLHKSFIGFNTSDTVSGTMKRCTETQSPALVKLTIQRPSLTSG